METTLVKDIKGLNNCYFLCSSKSDQPSYQDHHLSFFTKCFAEAIKNHKAEEIRYKDIIDYIFDEFSKEEQQTPFFVNQGDYKEIFASNISELKKSITEFLKNLQSSDKVESLEEEISLSLEDLVKREAINYREEDEVINIFNNIEEKIKHFEYSDVFNKLYEKPSIGFINNKEQYIESLYPVEDIAYSTEISKIGEWLVNNFEKNYFAKVLYKKVEYQEEVFVPQYNTLGIWYGRDRSQTKSITQTKNVVSGFDLTWSYPFWKVMIEVAPKHINLSRPYCNIIIFTSKKSIVFFYFYSTYLEENWTRLRPSKYVEWIVQEVDYKNEEKIYLTIETIINGFQHFIINPIEKKFQLTDIK